MDELGLSNRNVESGVSGGFDLIIDDFYSFEFLCCNEVKGLLRVAKKRVKNFVFFEHIIQVVGDLTEWFFELKDGVST